MKKRIEAKKRSYSPIKPSGNGSPSKNRRSSQKRSNARYKNTHRPQSKDVSVSGKLPSLENNIRIMPLGGVEEVGRNMTAIECGNDIVILDMGFQFRDESTPGVDYLLPNTKYLEENKHKIRAVFITHGHLDHIGGIPYLIDRIGNPPIYSRSLTTIMINKRQEEFPHLVKLNIHIVENEDVIKVGDLRARFFSVTHTIPDSMGVIIETPYGDIVNPGDIKLDHVDGEPTDKEKEEYSIFKNRNVLFLMADSTNVENPGFSSPERLVHEGLEQIIKDTSGRLIIGTFASQIERIIKIIEISEKYGKKVVVEGRSMKSNIEIIRKAEMLKVDKSTIISVEEMEDYPPDKIVALATGAQGDEFAALMRMSNKTHKNFTLNKRDTILLSSSVIPGNESAVMKLKDNLSRQGAKIIHYRSIEEIHVHSTGHGYRGELEWVHKQIRPKFFMPIHGSHYMLRVHERLAKDIGMSEENIVVPDNGTVVEIRDGGNKLTTLPNKVAEDPLVVDGFSVANIQDVVIRDRKMLSEDGMFVIIVSINVKTGKLKKSPDIISRGFVYLRESQDLLQQTRLIIKKTVENTTKGMNPINFDFVKDNITDDVSRFLLQKTAKRPVVIPVVLGS